MNASDAKMASPLFNTVRRSHGHEMVMTVALLIAGYLGVASVLLENYQQPDVSVASARV